MYCEMSKKHLEYLAKLMDHLKSPKNEELLQGVSAFDPAMLFPACVWVHPISGKEKMTKHARKIHLVDAFKDNVVEMIQSEISITVEYTAIG